MSEKKPDDVPIRIIGTVLLFIFSLWPSTAIGLDGVKPLTHESLVAHSPFPSLVGQSVAEESVVAAEVQASPINSSQNASAPEGSPTITKGMSRIEELGWRIAFCTKSTDIEGIVRTIWSEGTDKYNESAWCWH